MKPIDKLIVNSPYRKPEYYHEYERETRSFIKKTGRRRAGYIIASERSKSFDDPGKFVEIPLVNQIRLRVDAWRSAGYPGCTGITKTLLQYWNDKDRYVLESAISPFFFCQIEAIETLIWLCEAPESSKVGINIPSDGGDFLRLCSKMATGTGKTVVMAMVICWQVLNKITYPQDKRFSKNIFIVAPGLTVKSRLNVLYPSSPNNFYENFNMLPLGLIERLREGKILINNWHILNWETEEQIAKRRSVDKRGAKSDRAYVREVLGDLVNSQQLVVINDEAHHAWRVPAESKIKGVAKEEIEEATKWIGGLDRIHKVNGILCCYDFSATPFAPSGKRSSEEALFGWIVSDFGLNDAIEAGLVKTPRIVIRDDALPDTKNFKSRLYHIYNDPEVKEDINRKAEPQDALPSLITNAYYLLGYDWRETKRAWEKKGHKIPPVMITVANRTETAARIEHAFNHGNILIEELCSTDHTLRIDSKVLEMAEAKNQGSMENDGLTVISNRKITKKQESELLRRKVDTVGQTGQIGEQIRNVISVGMLSEGWDARTVTHIMGLRAFSSQLLCEQVIGRGLRRTSYEVNETTGLFEPEYVNIFGVPFTFLPHESQEGIVPPPPEPKTRIEPDSKKEQFIIEWPNIIRINYIYKPHLELDIESLSSLELRADNIILTAEVAAAIGGKPDLTKATQIELQKLAKDQRQQRIIFQAASNLLDQMNPKFSGYKPVLLGQLVRIVEQFINSGLIHINPLQYHNDPIRRKLVISLNINEIVQHIWSAIKQHNQESIEPVFDKLLPIRSTKDMRTWYTGRPCDSAKHSHINLCVHDGTWESTQSYELDRNKHVDAWVKNDHLGFDIFYVYQGVIKKYRPDYLIRLKNNHYLILETKGQDSAIVQAKKQAAEEWVKAVNVHQGFGTWHYAISFHPKEVELIIENYGKL